MEDRKLSERESLELITKMIQETQNNTARYAAYPSLIWGYTTIAIALIIWFAVVHLQAASHIHLLWFALPAIAAPLSYYFLRKNPRVGVKNYMDRIINQVWTILGVTAVLLSVCAFFTSVPILFVIALMISIGITLSGCIARYKPMFVCGICGMLLSAILLFIESSDQLLLFAFTFVVICVIPGHLLNKELKKSC